MPITAIRLKPPERIIVLDRYKLDQVALEFDELGALQDCRFEFGCGYDIYWAVPVSRLRPGAHPSEGSARARKRVHGAV